MFCVIDLRYLSVTAYGNLIRCLWDSATSQVNLTMTTKITFKKGLTAAAILAVTSVFATNRPNFEIISADLSRDLSLTHSLSHESVQSGDILYLTFSLQNLDLEPAQDILIKLDIPHEIFLESYDVDQGDFIEEEGLWTIRHLAGGNDVSIKLNLLPTTNENMPFSAHIASAEPVEDPVLQNNQTQGVIKVQGDDCTVVYNDFGTDPKEPAYFLYIDCVGKYPKNVLYIYDRWGNLVFEQEGYDNTWNGKRHPRFTRHGWDKLPTGTYYYVLNFPEGDRSDKSGWIYLSE